MLQGFSTNLIEKYKEEIRKAHEYLPNQQGYLDHYKNADAIENRLKTEYVKKLYQVIAIQLDEIEAQIRLEKTSIIKYA